MIDLPSPLVPPDTDIKDLDGFMLNTEKLMASELWALSTGEEFKAAVALWCRAWKQTPPGSLPEDDRVLAAFSGAGSRWKKIRDMALRGFVKCSDGRLYHAVLCEDVLRAARKKAERRGRTKAATEARQKQRDVERDVERDDLPGTGQGQGHKDPIPTPQVKFDPLKGEPPITTADAAVMADEQAILDQGVDLVQSRGGLSFAAAQTFISSLCKLHDNASVAAAVRLLLAASSVVEPRSWLRAQLEKNPHGTPFGRRPTSAVERVKAAAKDRQRRAAAVGEDY